MNYADIIFIIFIALAAWRGFRKGLIIEIFTLLALLVGIYAGIHFSDWTSQKLIDNFDLEKTSYLPVVAFTLTFLAVGALVYFAGKALEKIVEVAHLSIVNRILGLFFSVVKVVYFLSIILVLVETYDERGNFIPTSVKQESMLYYPIQKVATTTIPKVKESLIWVENSAPFQMLKEGKENVDDWNRFRQKADSLGVRERSCLTKDKRHYPVKCVNYF